MKPENFPERERQRRMDALERLRRLPSLNAMQKAEFAKLTALTIAAQRDIRSKKNRSARGRFSNSAA